MQQKVTKKQSQPQFVCKLIDMIQKFPVIINWDLNGDKIIVFNIQQMQEKVLPQYFRHSNFASFIRQLNMYNFHKLYKRGNEIGFKNQIFKRGNENNFHFIQRKKRIKQQQQMSQQFQKKNQQVLLRLNKQSQIQQPIKKLIRQLLQYKYVAIDNIKKIKNKLDNICEQLKQCRTKKIIEILNNIKNKLLVQISGEIKMAKDIDNYLQKQFLKYPQTRENLSIIEQYQQRQNIQNYSTRDNLHMKMNIQSIYQPQHSYSSAFMAGLTQQYHHNFQQNMNNFLSMNSYMGMYSISMNHSLNHSINHSIKSQSDHMNMRNHNNNFDNFDDDESRQICDQGHINEIIKMKNNNININNNQNKNKKE